MICSNMQMADDVLCLMTCVVKNAFPVAATKPGAGVPKTPKKRFSMGFSPLGAIHWDEQEEQTSFHSTAT